MKRDLKSISYAFILNRFNVYTSEIENCFIVEMLRCRKCSNYWPTTLDQCYLCGEINHYLFTCSQCGQIQSITGSSQSCKKCNSKTLIMACINNECPSNSIKVIKEDIIRNGGIFNKKSAWKISLTHCMKCGNRSNGYHFQRIFVFNSQLENNNMNRYLSKNKLQNGDILIYKTKKNNIVFYDYLKVSEENEPLKFRPSYQEDRLAKIINNL